MKKHHTQKMLINITEWIHRKLKRKMYTNADPNKIIYVNPSDIQYESHSKWGTFLRKPGRIIGGKWDQSLPKFTDRIQYEGIKSHFVEGVDWKETQYYQERLRGNIGELNEEEKIDEYMNKIDNLYHSVKNNSYKLQEELDTSEWYHNQKREIGVNIGRDGKFIWHFDGQHRLSIAKILNIDKVPVRVLVRHRRWESIRNKIKSGCNNKVPNEYSSHPDGNHMLVN